MEKVKHEETVLHKEQVRDILSSLCREQGLDYFLEGSLFDPISEDNALHLTIHALVGTGDIKPFRRAMSKARRILGTKTVPSYKEEREDEIGASYIVMDWDLADINALPETEDEP